MNKNRKQAHLRKHVKELFDEKKTKELRVIDIHSEHRYMKRELVCDSLIVDVFYFSFTAY